MELNNNKITDISALKYMPLNLLNSLNLSNNLIKNVKALENLNAPKIRSLIINNNLLARTLQKNIDIFNNLRDKFHFPYFYIIQ